MVTKKGQADTFASSFEIENEADSVTNTFYRNAEIYLKKILTDSTLKKDTIMYV